MQKYSGLEGFGSQPERQSLLNSVYIRAQSPPLLWKVVSLSVYSAWPQTHQGLITSQTWLKGRINFILHALLMCYAGVIDWPMRSGHEHPDAAACLSPEAVHVWNEREAVVLDCRSLRLMAMSDDVLGFS